MGGALFAGILVFSGVAALAASSANAADHGPINQPPTLQDWQALAKLPDFSGIWTPVIIDQFTQERTNPPPWKPAIAKQIAHMYAEEAGRAAVPGHRSLLSDRHAELYAHHAQCF